MQTSDSPMGVLAKGTSSSHATGSPSAETLKGNICGKVMVLEVQVMFSGEKHGDCETKLVEP